MWSRFVAVNETRSRMATPFSCSPPVERCKNAFHWKITCACSIDGACALNICGFNRLRTFAVSSPAKLTPIEGFPKGAFHRPNHTRLLSCHELRRALRNRGCVIELIAAEEARDEIRKDENGGNINPIIQCWPSPIDMFAARGETVKWASQEICSMHGHLRGEYLITIILTQTI